MLVQVNRSDRKLESSHPHMGIASLAAYSIHQGYETSAIDAMYEGLDNKTLLEQIVAFGPTVLGITAKTPDIPECEKLAQKVKKSIPDVNIVVGGAHITALRGRVLEECSSFDFGIMGEGEYAFTALLDHLYNKRAEMPSIAGLIHRENGSLVEIPSAAFIDDLDVLLYPAWHLFPHGTDIPLFLSRGCPFKCIFCQRVMGDKVRMMSPQRAVDDVERSIKDHGATFFQIEDETFGVNKRWTFEFLELLISKGLNNRIKWAANSRVNLADVTMYETMKKAGCCLLGFGIESGNQEILDTVHKGFKLDQAMEAIAIARKAGISTSAFFILGHPNETPKTVRDTINFACKLNPDMASFGIMVPYPGTEIYELAKANKGGYSNLSEDWSQYTKYFGEPMEFNNFRTGQLARYQKRAYLEFYVRNLKFRKLWTTMKRYINRQS